MGFPASTDERSGSILAYNISTCFSKTFSVITLQLFFFSQFYYLKGISKYFAAIFHLQSFSGDCFATCPVWQPCKSVSMWYIIPKTVCTHWITVEMVSKQHWKCYSLLMVGLYCRELTLMSLSIPPAMICSAVSLKLTAVTWYVLWKLCKGTFFLASQNWKTHTHSYVLCLLSTEPFQAQFFFVEHCN